VSFVAGVASVSGLSICACPFCFLFFFVTCLLFPVLPVYLDCLFVLAFLFSLFLRHVSFGNTGNKRQVTKKKKKKKGQAQIDNPDTLATPGKKDT
jgi:hypothetical protein